MGEGVIIRMGSETIIFFCLFFYGDQCALMTHRFYCHLFVYTFKHRYIKQNNLWTWGKKLDVYV